MSLYRTGRKLRVSRIASEITINRVRLIGEVLGYERPLFFKPDEMGKSIR